MYSLHADSPSAAVVAAGHFVSACWTPGAEGAHWGESCRRFQIGWAGHQVFLLQCAVVDGVCQSQSLQTLGAGWGPQFDPEVKLGKAQLSAGHKRPPVPCCCAGLSEERYSQSSAGSAVMQAGQTSVSCVGLVVERHKMSAVVAAGTDAPPWSTVDLVAVLLTVLLRFYFSPALL